MKRRNILISAGLLAVGAASGSQVIGLISPRTAKAQDSGVTDRVLGDPDAPVTLIEYASLTCPHCASFHANVMPHLKKNWIDTGKAKMIYRHFPLDALALRASGLTECVAGDSFFGFVDLLFSTQQQWARSNDPVGALKSLARQAGIDDDAAEACLTNEEDLRAIMEQRKVGSDDFGVNATPSLIINGEKFEGPITPASLDSELEELTGG
ncbi:MAG: DsbA family protein [Pseudomonadota bacterium]